ncbi:MAG: hypothetical protein ACKVP2_13190, partial [Burkholderiales bacterium]
RVAARDAATGDAAAGAPVTDAARTGDTLDLLVSTIAGGTLNNGLAIVITVANNGDLTVTGTGVAVGGVSGAGSGDDGSGIAGILNIIGNPAANIRIVGPDAGVVWTLDDQAGVGSGTLAITGGPTITFTNVLDITGGSGSDIFVLKSTYTRTANLTGGAGSDQLVISSGTTVNVAFTGGGGYDSVVNQAGTSGSKTFSGVENLIDRPLIFIPGFGGSFVDTNLPGTPLADWYLTRGFDPTKLTLEPLTNGYSDLVQTLVNTGYVDGTNKPLVNGTLYVSLWDWRTPVAVTSDGAEDGVLSDVTAASIRDWAFDSFDSGLDYFAYWMDKAAAGWQNLTGSAAAEIDVITHSTGGLISRSYLQSAAYGQSGLLPVKTLIQTGVPNQGVGGNFGLLNNDFALNAATRGLAATINSSYKAIKAGGTLRNPDGTTITAANLPGETAFVGLYVAAFGDLLATYPFLDNLDDGVQALIALDAAAGGNSMLLDLNALDPAGFAKTRAQSATARTYVVYSAGVDTPDLAIRQTGFKPLLGTQNEILPFGSVLGRLPASGETWYEIKNSPGRGDGTVTVFSAKNGFESVVNVADGSAVLVEVGAGRAIEHTKIQHDVDSQKAILGLLPGVDVLSADLQISTSLLLDTKAMALNLIRLGALDPVEAALQAFADAKALVADVHGRIESKWNQDLPLIGLSVRDLLSDSNHGLGYDPFAKFSSAATDALAPILGPTIANRVAQLEEILEDALGLVDIGVAGFDNPELELSFNESTAVLTMAFDFNLTRSSSYVLDPAAAGGPLSGDPLTLDLVADLDLDFVVELDFGKLVSFAVGGTGTDGLKLTLNEFNASVTLSKPAGVPGTQTLQYAGVGALSVTLQAANISAGLGVAFTSSSTITLADLRTQSFASLVTFTPIGSIDIDLDVTAAINNPGFVLSGSGSLSIDTGNIFSGVVPPPVVTINSATFAIPGTLQATGTVTIETGGNGELKVSGMLTGSGSGTVGGVIRTDVLITAGPIVVAGSADLTLSTSTVDVDTDGNGNADLIGATLDALTLTLNVGSGVSVTGAGGAAGATSLTLSGSVAVARVTAAGETVARYSVLKMGSVIVTGNTGSTAGDFGLSGTLTIAGLDYNGVA